MSNQSLVMGVLLDETVQLSFTDVCESCKVSEEMLLDLIEYGLFNTQKIEVETQCFNSAMVQRVQSARRLQDDLGVNLAGAVLVLELLDALAEARQELDVLQRHFLSK